MTAALLSHAVMLNFSTENLMGIIPEVRPLWEMHWNETEGYRSKDEPYEPQLSQFAALVGAGMWRQFCARDDVSGLLVGHIGYIVHKNRHTGVVNAVEDYFFIHPEYRKGMNALALLRYAVGELRSEGIRQIYMSNKLTHDIGALLRRVGFKAVANFWLLEN